MKIFLRPLTSHLSLLTLLLFFAGCASVKPLPHYTAPSAAPVREKISSAKTSIASAQSHAEKAKAAVAELQTENLKLKAEAGGELDALTIELLNAQSALKDADSRISNLESQVTAQTAALNQAADRVNAALTAQAKAEKQAAEDRRHVHKLKFYICSAGAVIVGLFLFQFRSLLMLAGPWVLGLTLLGGPALAFGFLWKLL